MQFSQNIDSFRVTKLFTGLLELIVLQLYKQNPLEKFLIFSIYQNYTLALSNDSNRFDLMKITFDEYEVWRWNPRKYALFNILLYYLKNWLNCNLKV